MTSNRPTTHNEPDDPDGDDRLELYVLDMLPDDERAEIESMLRRDSQARERARELRGVVSSLAFDLEPMQPSAGLRGRILDAARADEPGRRVEPAPVAAPVSLTERRDERTSRRGSLASRWAPWAVAAMLAVALVGSMVWNVNLRERLDERVITETYAVVSVGPAEGTNGELLVVDDRNTALLALSNLPELEPGRVYQVWLIDEGDPVPNVTFQPNTVGAASVAVPGDIESYRLLAITVEPEGGSTAPTTDPIISSPLTD